MQTTCPRLLRNGIVARPGNRTRVPERRARIPSALTLNHGATQMMLKGEGRGRVHTQSQIPGYATGQTNDAHAVRSLNVLVEAGIGTMMGWTRGHSATVSGVDVARIRNDVMVRFESVSVSVVRAGVRRLSTADGPRVAEALGRVGERILKTDGVLGG